MKWLSLSLALSLFTMGCTDPYGEAEQAGTIEAFDAFLEANPTHADALKAKIMVEKLMLEKARESKSMEDYDAYLKRFKKNPTTKKQYQKVQEERKDVLFDKAAETNSVEAWETFIEEYKVLSPKDARIAKQRLEVAKYATNLQMDPLEKAQVNLSGDDNGPLNGWEFSTRITNKGTKDIEALRMRISFLDADGLIVDRQDYTVIGCGDYCQRMFVFEDPSYAEAEPELGRIRPPMKSQETRDFIVQTGNVPANWSKKVRTDFLSIKFSK